MNERITFLCIGKSRDELEAERAWLSSWLSSLLKGVLSFPLKSTEVLLINGETSQTYSHSWESIDTLLSFVGKGQLLTVYAREADETGLGVQSLSFEQRLNFKVTTLSLSSELLRVEGNSFAKILSRLASLSTTYFNEAALACGPEMDLYTLSESPLSVSELEDGLASDWRCWMSMSSRSFPQRVKMS